MGVQTRAVFAGNQPHAHLSASIRNAKIGRKSAQRQNDGGRLRAAAEPGTHQEDFAVQGVTTNDAQKDNA